MSTVLVYSHSAKLAQELLSAAKTIGEQVYAVSINDDEQAQALAACGANVLKISQTEVCLSDTAAVASAVRQAANQAKADTILLSSDRSGKELAGRLAQILEADCLTGVNSIAVNNGQIECSRNALGGATVAVQVIKGTPKVIAISPKSFEPATEVAGGNVSELAVETETSLIKVVEVKDKTVESVDIEAADLLIAIGQGVEDESQVAVVQDIARAIGGEVACSKPVATDKKWLSEERVIGISGKICKPEVAILLGISGQVQFLVGIRDAKTIISVNSDENALINDMADYVLVADAKDVIAELKSSVS